MASKPKDLKPKEGGAFNVDIPEKPPWHPSNLSDDSSPDDRFYSMERGTLEDTGTVVKPVWKTGGKRTPADAAEMYVRGTGSLQSKHMMDEARDYTARGGKVAEVREYMGSQAPEYGLKWGGTFKKNVDKPHFETAKGASRQDRKSVMNNWLSEQGITRQQLKQARGRVRGQRAGRTQKEWQTVRDTQASEELAKLRAEARKELGDAAKSARSIVENVTEGLASTIPMTPPGKVQ